MDPLFSLSFLNDELIEHWEHVRLSVRSPFWLVVAIIVVPISAWLIHRRHALSLKSLSPRTRFMLTALRTTILAAMFGILIEPELVLDHQFQQQPLLAIVVDESASMDLPVGAYPQTASNQAFREKMQQIAAANPSTWEQSKRRELAWEAVRSWLASPAAPASSQWDVRVMALRDTLVPLEQPPEAANLDEPNEDSTIEETRLGDALAKWVEQSAGQDIAGIVLVTDGQNTSGRTLLQGALAARRAQAPIFAVPAGSPMRVTDIALLETHAPNVVSTGDTARVAVTLQSGGFDGRTIEVSLREGDKVIETKSLKISSGEQQRLEFDYPAEKAGVHTLSIEATEQPEETIRSNNRQYLTLNVSDEKKRVLLVDGWPRWDFRFLRNALARDSGIDLTVHLTTEPETSQPLPKTVEGLVQYDVMILGDVPPSTLTPEYQKLIDEAVTQRGLGLILASGIRHLPRDYRQQPLSKVLPIIPAVVTSPMSSQGERLAIPPLEMEHAVMQLVSEPQRNARLWNDFPEFYWHSPVERLQPGATVLATLAGESAVTNPVPIIAYQQVGEGTVLYLGMDSTWRWRQNVGDRYFGRFWGQAIRFVAPSGNDRLPKERPSRIEFSPLLPRPGESINLTLFPGYDITHPLPATPTASLQVRGKSAFQMVPLTIDGTDKLRPGEKSDSWIGKFTAQEPGRYQVEFADPRFPAKAEIVVIQEEATAEDRQPDINREALLEAAQQTQGQLIELADLESITPLLQGESQERRIRQQQYLWDNPIVLLLLVTLYCLDVGIRRMTGLS